MSFLDGALDSLDPSQRVRQSLTNDLQLRRKDERTVARFSHHTYLGGADLLIRHGRFYTGRELPDAYAHLQGQSKRCFLNALEAAEQDDSLTYCEGVYTVGYGHPHLHAWCVAPDGEMVELTFPTRGNALSGYLNDLNMPFLPPNHWGYYGVTFNTRLVHAHLDAFTLPILDRSPVEVFHSKQKGQSPEFFDEAHDYPLLACKYDPNRTELP